jgi:hypothetical protein
MRIRPFLLMALSVIAPAAGAEVAVRFINPENFKDFTINSGPIEAMREDLMHQIGDHLRSLGDQYLPKGDTLELDVEDIDMAGGYEPWRLNMMWTRIMSSVWPPQITLVYVWKDKDGKLKADDRVMVTDPNYLAMVGSKEYATQDPLRYEKALLKRWFIQTFGSGSKPAAAGKP